MASTTRITGMYSGLDTEALVKEMLDANKTPLNNYTREKTEVEWQRETLIDLNSQLLDLQNMSKDMQSDSSFKVYTTQSTNSRIATATATTEALEGTYTITTEQLATTSTLTSSPVSKNSSLTSVASTGFIKYSNTAGGVSFENTSFNITLNGVTKTIAFGAGEGNFTNSAADKLKIGEVFQQKIDDAFGANQITVKSTPLGMGYKLSFACADEALDVPLQLTSATEGNDALSLMKIESGSTNIFDTTKTIAELTGKTGDMTYTINGRTETISSQTTIADFFKKINNSDAGVTVKYDALSDAIIMKRTESGAGRDIQIGDDFDLFEKLGLVDTYDMSAEEYEEFKTNNSKYSAGKNAIVSITDPEGRHPGKTFTDAEGNEKVYLELTSNSFTYEGVNFNLTKAAPGEEVSITVAKDVDTVFDNVVKFVDKYNEILGKLNELTNEKPNKDYDPLLDEERDELSETQQEKWDKLARQGILYRDSTLQSAISSMRGAVTSLVANNSDIQSLFQIGISTTAYSAVGNDNGKLVIDEEKLREAINNNMDEVAALFTNKPDYISGTVLADDAKITAGSSFSVTVNGKTETITFDKDYDLANADQKSELVSNINSILSNKYGGKNIVFAISGGRAVITSQKGNSVTLNSGTGTDALASLGLEDGVTYDANKLGFSNKIFNILETAMESISNKSGSNATSEDESILGERMKKLNDYISRQKDRLDRLEDRYYSQFSAMETALAQMESQSSYLTSMLSGSGM